ncbi:cell division protein FtsW [Verrucomicrobium sp. GAS474]|uniref:putative lipid II flippase FtsW n=1 Tax=Verrucomicrobium sp. GAS474 TaxID=1882831 RepID=UPI00087B8DED|nr:putative lipid II flippase FtsW [Verrucomicrobium sp. GAS474]SDU28787.1 cell division protein FtsW [Verrucomicrobium sp. GAS474]
MNRSSTAFFHRQAGYLLLVVVLSLIALGVVMLFSISGKQAAEGTGAIYGALRKQMVWVVIGGAACAVVSRIDYHRYVSKGLWVWASSIFLLLLVFVPHVGKKVKGSWRWIEVAGMTFQPSEFVKLAVIVFLAWWFAKYQRRLNSWKGMGVPVAVVFFSVCILIVSKDIGTSALLFAVLSVMLFVAGAPKRYLLPIPVLALSGLLTVAWLIPERRARLFAFLHPEESKAGKGYQNFQALIALGSGGTDGLGLGNSRQKMYYLPEAPTDFIFPIVGEELGLWICLGIVMAFLVLFLCSGWISIHAPDPSGLFLGTGITTMMGLQAMINLGVVTSLLPNKGFPLPFISYGGSNLLLSLVSIGILFNLHRQAVHPEEPQGTVLPGRKKGGPIRI